MGSKLEKFMSNLLKSKFLLGVMVVAAMFVAVGAIAPSSAAAATCTTAAAAASADADAQAADTAARP